MAEGLTARLAGSGGRETPRRVVAVLLALALGWQVLASGIRAVIADTTPLAVLCTGICGSDETDRADAAGRRGDRAEAVRSARLALERAPINQRALSLLALNGAPGRIVPLMTLAAALGWRDRLTSFWLLRASADAGDAALFAQRYDALGRQIEDPGKIAPLLDERIGDAAVRSAIVERMTLDPRWRHVYLGSLQAADPALVASRRELIGALAAAHDPAGPVELSPYVSRLDGLGLHREARATWRQFVARPDAWAGKVYDGTFRYLSGPGDYPYEWNVQDLPGAFASFDKSGGGALYARNDGNAAGPLVTQSLALAPGRYALAVRTRTGANADVGMAWSLRCTDGRNLIDQTDHRGITPVAPGPSRYGVTVPGGCAAQTLSLDAVPGRPLGGPDLWVERVRLDRVAGVDAPARL